MSMLVRATTSPDSSPTIRRGTVTDALLDGRITVDLGGGQDITCERMDSYAPALGEVVYVQQMDVSTWLCIGRRSSAAPGTLPVTVSFAVPWAINWSTE
ncbi:MAG: hypothetical protein IPM08_17455 [Actinomycetales bacterium]|nr:hypothetical protein [Actinomycetales bacterium]